MRSRFKIIKKSIDVKNIIKKNLSKTKENFKKKFTFVDNLICFPRKNQESLVVDSSIKNINKGVETNSKGDVTMPKNIRQRKNGLWECRIRKNNKSYSLYARSKTEIKQKLNKLKRELALKDELCSDMTVKEYFEHWFYTYKKNFITEKTQNHIKMIFQKHIFPMFSNNLLTTLNAFKIQTFLNSIQKSRTKEFIITYFRAMLTKAWQENIINTNPFNLIVVEKRIKANKKPFNLEEQKRILECFKTIHTEYYEIIRFYLLTGVRRTEATNITINDFKFGNTIHIAGTKTETSNRDIIVQSKYYEHLKNICCGDRLFNFKNTYLSEKFKDVLKSLKIEGNLHCLRHTYACNMYSLGANIKFVQNQMGHSSFTITADIYTNIKRKEDKIEIQKLYNNYYYMEQ